MIANDLLQLCKSVHKKHSPSLTCRLNCGSYFIYFSNYHFLCLSSFLSGFPESKKDGSNPMLYLVLDCDSITNLLKMSRTECLAGFQPIKRLHCCNCILFFLLFELGDDFVGSNSMASYCSICPHSLQIWSECLLTG